MTGAVMTSASMRSSELGYSYWLLPSVAVVDAVAFFSRTGGFHHGISPTNPYLIVSAHQHINVLMCCSYLFLTCYPVHSVLCEQVIKGFFHEVLAWPFFPYTQHLKLLVRFWVNPESDGPLAPTDWPPVFLIAPDSRPGGRLGLALG